MKICLRCREKRAISKGLCPRCYRATKMGYKTRSEIKQERSYIENGVGIIESSRGTKYKLDIEDFNKLSQYIWTDNGNGYAKNDELGYMHKVIRPDIRRTDHINQDTTDNRRSNLREGYYINVLNTNKRKIPCPIYRTRQGMWYGRTQIEGKIFYIQANKNRSEIVKKISKILKKANRIQFYNLENYQQIHTIKSDGNNR